MLKAELQELGETVNHASREAIESGPLTRRELMSLAAGSAVGAGLLAYMSGEARAAASGYAGAAGSPLTQVYTQELNGDGSAISVEDDLSFDGAQGGPYPTIGNVQAYKFVDRQGAGSQPELAVQSDGDVQYRDATGTILFALNHGGPVVVENTDLRIPTGNVIDRDLQSSFDTLIDIRDTGGAYQSFAERSVSGDNSAHDLGNPNPVGDRWSGLVVVVGSIDDANVFSDLVLVAATNAITVVNSSSRGTVGSRTYSNSGNGFAVAIDDSGSTYTVQAIGLGGALNA